MKTCDGTINNPYSPRLGERCGRPTTGRYCGHHDPAKRDNHRSLRKAAWQRRREALKNVMRVDARQDRLVVEVLRRPMGEELKLVLGAFRRALRNGKGAVLVVAQEGA